jgi:hypothetical protein
MRPYLLEVIVMTNRVIGILRVVNRLNSVSKSPIQCASAGLPFVRRRQISISMMFCGTKEQ